MRWIGIWLLAGAAVGLACSSESSSDPKGRTTSPTDCDEPGTNCRDAGATDPRDSGGSDDAQPQPDAGADSGADAAATAYTKAEVQSLFGSRCAPCHTAGAAGGLALAPDFTTTTVGVASQQAPPMVRLKAGDRTQSYLFHKVSGTQGTVGGSGGQMPPNAAPLSSAELERLGLYIDGL